MDMPRHVSDTNRPDKQPAYGVTLSGLTNSVSSLNAALQMQQEWYVNTSLMLQGDAMFTSRKA